MKLTLKFLALAAVACSPMLSITPVMRQWFTINAMDYGCKADGASDDTTCLTNWVNYLNTHPYSLGYAPGGKYLYNGNLRLNASTSIHGDGYENTFFIETNATSDLLTLTGSTQIGGGWDPGPQITGITFAGQGTSTTGNLLVVNATNVTIDSVGFAGHGGNAILLLRERVFMHNIRMSHVRRFMSDTNNIADNESYLRNFTVLGPGNVINDLGTGTNNANVCTSVNSTNGVYPSSGNVQQDIHAAIELGANVANFEISNGSIKPLLCTGGIRVRATLDMHISNVFIEGFNNGSVNPSITYGGAHITSTGQNSITGTATTFDVVDGQWFSPFVSSSADLPGVPTLFVIRPPDYILGSSAASSLGGGVLKGTYELVNLNGILHDSVGTGWHAVLTAGGRALLGTSQIAWPAGFVFEEGWSSVHDTNSLPFPGSLTLENDVLTGVNPQNTGYTVVSDPNNQKTFGEVVVGMVPDLFYLPFSANINTAGRAVAFYGHNYSAHTSLMNDPSGIVDVHSSGVVDLRHSAALPSILSFLALTGGNPDVPAPGVLIQPSGTLRGSDVWKEYIRNTYLIGGYYSSGTIMHYQDPTAELYSFGPASNQWTGHAEMPSGVTQLSNVLNGLTRPLQPPEANSIYTLADNDTFCSLSSSNLERCIGDLVLQVNGTNAISQKLLNITGTGGITVTDNGTGTWTLNCSGCGGGGSMVYPAAGIPVSVAGTSWGSSLSLLTGVTAGTYTNATLTVDANGRLTAASNGTSSGSITITAGRGVCIDSTATSTVVPIDLCKTLDTSQKTTLLASQGGSWLQYTGNTVNGVGLAGGAGAFTNSFTGGVTPNNDWSTDICNANTTADIIFTISGTSTVNGLAAGNHFTVVHGHHAHIQENTTDVQVSGGDSCVGTIF